MRLAKERSITLMQHNANSHRMSKAHTNALPFPHKRTSTKLAIINPETGHTVHGAHALEAWRHHMIKHLTDQPIRIIRNTFINDNQESPDKQEGSGHSDADTSNTLTSGSDTPEAVHTRRTRTGSGRELLREQTSSEDENINTTHMTPTADTSQSTRTSNSHQRQPTIRELFEETPKGYDV